MKKLTKAQKAELEKLLYTRFKEEQDVQLNNRIAMSRDEDFYDGMQYTDAEAQEMEERGQPVLVYNEIKRSVDWTSGTERKAKVDWSVAPRLDEKEEADAKTKYIKYISDVNDAPDVRSKAFKKAIIAGVGWMEEGYNKNAPDEPIFVREENWRNIWYDHLGKADDLSDSRHIFRRRYVDLDTAQTYFPKFKNDLEAASRMADVGEEYAVDDNAFYQSAPSRPTNEAYSRQRVALIQCEYRKPVSGKFMRSEEHWQLNNLLYNEAEHGAHLDDGSIDIVDSVQQQTFVCIMLDQGDSFKLLQHSINPYKHNHFTFTPIWCYRRARDGAPYGLVRNSIDPQRDLNKRRSKALHILATKGIIMEENAVDDKDELAREIARPDFIIETKMGKRLEVVQDKALANEHIMLAEQDSGFIRSAFGVTGENMGIETNASSGVAIRARQMEGIVSTSEVFGNHAKAFRHQGRKLLSITEQYVTDPKYFYITGDQEQIKLNTGPGNDITARQSVFVVSEQEYRSTARMAIFEMMLDLVTKVSQYSPEIGLNLLDLVVEMADIPQSRKFVERIRNITGQDDSEDKSAEEIEAEQMQSQLEQMAIQLEMAQKKADVDETNASAASKNADAQRKKAQAEKDTADTLRSKVEAITTAMQNVPHLTGTGIPELTEELVKYARTM